MANDGKIGCTDIRWYRGLVSATCFKKVIVDSYWFDKFGIAVAPIFKNFAVVVVAAVTLFEGIVDVFDAPSVQVTALTVVFILAVLVWLLRLEDNQAVLWKSRLVEDLRIV